MIKKVLVIILFIPCLCQGAVTIDSASISGSTLTIAGSGFGSKTSAAPLKYTGFESDTTGQVPAGWDAPSDDSLVTASAAHGGNKSLDSSALSKTTDYFPRTSWDTGATIGMGEYLYLSAWLYLDTTGTTATGWNWKGPIITSSTVPYYWDAGTTNESAVGFGGFYNGNWFNTAVTIQYSSGNNAAFDYCSAGNSWHSSSFVFSSWQRVEWIFKASSSAGASDGSITVNRVGAANQPLAATGCVTYGTTSNLWRYVSFPQGITNINGGTLNLAMYFDDVYIDKGLSRVEICDVATWSSRAHCEIQPPTAWSTTGVTATVNQGAFANGSTGYAFVIDSAGLVNATGDSVTFGEGEADTTAPTIPTASVNGTTITITASETIVTTGYDANDCALTCTTAGTVNLTSPTGSGASRTLTGSASIANGDTCTLGCTLGTDDIEDAAGNDMITFSGLSVTVNTPMVHGGHFGPAAGGGWRNAAGQIFAPAM